MVQIQSFIFSDFSENTYVLWDETKQCAIIDPGCYYENERQDLKKFIEGKDLTPGLLLNTHCHIDHIFGNKWVKEQFKVPFYAHHADLFLLNAASATGRMYGMAVEPSPVPDKFIDEGDKITFGNTELSILFTPGHSPGSISFYYEGMTQNNVQAAGHSPFIISGDVLFQNSIGRFDLPGGDYETLMQSIFNKLLPLHDQVTVYSGHGPATTIGSEQRNNPFIREYEMERKK